MSNIAIIGGGPAGLALAHDLSGSHHDVTVFETAAELGGLARSFLFGDIRMERYYHFICADDTGYFRKLRELGLEGKLRWAPTRMGFFYDGRLYPFSSAVDLLRFSGIRFHSRVRYGLLILYCSLLKEWRHLDTVPAEQWLIKALGRQTYMATWYPLLKVKFGQNHDQISAAWVWHRIHRVARSRRTPLHKEMLGHLVGGTDTLIDGLVAESKRRNVTFRSGCSVDRIMIEDGQVIGLETSNGECLAFDHVVAAIPLPRFLQIAPDLPEEYLRHLATIDTLGVVCVALRLSHSLTQNYWLNVNDPRVPFNGCIEYTNLNPKMTPDGSKILYIPYYLERGHERFTRSEEELVQECVKALQVINPDFRADWVLDYAVSQDPYAQAICATGFAQRMPAHQTPIRNLYVIDACQIYPSDRTISGMIDLALRVARLVDSAESGGSLPAK